MGERIRFHFDPACPWAWQSSKWLREVQRVRDVEIEWRLFSVAVVNQDSADPLADPTQKSSAALRALALVRRRAGNAAVGKLYETFGARVHEEGEEPYLDTVRKALSDVGLEAGLADRALRDPHTADEVRADHEQAVDDVGAFGVPTVVLPSGKGIFGPVLSLAPVGEEAGRLWDHVRWLIEKDGFFELKRARDRKPGEA